MFNFEKTNSNIIKIFNESHMSIDEILDKLDISMNVYNEWKSYKTTPTLANIEMICKIFNKTLDEILVFE